jgi:hypothetical protein
MNGKQDNAMSPQGGRNRWERPAIQKVGTVADVLKGGEGKLSASAGDPGDQRKPSGGGE